MKIIPFVFLCLSSTKTIAFPSPETAPTNVSADKKLDVPQEIISGPFSNLLLEKKKGRETAFFEVQGVSLYDNAQKIFTNILRPKPIVDTIAEHEKYGNNGDQFRSIGNTIVGGYENFSNLLNSALELPIEAMKQISRRAANYLNGIGAKFVGL